MIPAVTARHSSEIDQTVSMIRETYPKVKAIGVAADGCKLSDLKMLVSKVTLIQKPTVNTWPIICWDRSTSTLAL